MTTRTPFPGSSGFEKAPDVIQAELLRLMLPPTRMLETATVRAAWRLPQGEWHEATFEHLADVAVRLRARRVEACPHPSEVSMTELTLPPLPAKLLRTALLGELDLLVLSDTATLAVASGTRTGTGQVPLAWMSAEALSQITQTLQRIGLPVQAVLPPPAFLPQPEDGESGDGRATAVCIDDWVVVRSAADEGLLLPNAEGSRGAAQIEQRLRATRPDHPGVRWLQLKGEGDFVSDGPAARTQVDSEDTDGGHGEEASELPAPSTSAWSGSGWTWSLPLARRHGAGADHRWLAPALGWSMAAAMVAVVGLQVQASDLAAQGKALSRQMAADVKAAFPDVPVVINPLQQARQLRDARRAGVAVGGAPSDDPAALLRAGAALLPNAQGQLQRLAFQDGQLWLQWREGAAFGADELQALQAQAQARGLTVLADAQGLRLQVDASKAPPAAGASTAQTSAPVRVGVTP
ncbi:type II secretion system protein GspL [Roseateles amylovorans]|uniref:Type II secretion system protein GspL n=1 Tax=Roseateles amylovorans TaxID=2978473 RepID=A0ABY6AXX4_9BURK|nr:type II secretion system protein GspL [Roseateles amylovorans]UXH77430.1 type II secretion system protein GspL [Roseateles amylovorans]